jgi:O-antigen/teichoic acid export membrane protein
MYRRIGRPQLSVDPRFWAPLMRVAAPIGLAGVFGTVFFRVDTALLAWFESDEVVGQYGAAFRLFESTLFVSWSVGTAVYPVFSRLSRETEPPIAAVFDRTLKLVVAVTLLIAVAAGTVGRPLVELLYGSAYAEAGTALILLAPAIALYPVAHVAGVLLYARDRQIAMATVYGLAAVANVVLNLVLIAAFSLDGAAVAASLTWLLLATALLALAVQTGGGLDAGRVVGGPILAAAVSAVAFAVFRSDVILALGIGTVAYLASLVAYERRVHPEDARSLGDFLRRRS